MITDYEYNLEKVKEFLLKKEKEGFVRLCRRYNSYYKRDDEGIICEIEGYNKDIEGRDFYINFYCLIENESQVSKNSFSGINYVKEWLKPFETGRGEP